MAGRVGPYEVSSATEASLPINLAEVVKGS